MNVIINLFLFLPTLVFGALDFSSFDGFQQKWTKEEIEERLGLFLQKDGQLSTYFSLTPEAFILYDAPDTEKERKIEYRLNLAKQMKSPCPKPRRKNLIGARIAIDPGHFGGKYARLEERFIDIPPCLERADQVQFDEGTLSYLTAFYLKILLEKEGAIVLITRKGIGKGGYEENFFSWLKKNHTSFAKEISLNVIFRQFYNNLDLRARAEKINAFNPDLSVIIHYNCHDIQGQSSNNCVVSPNYNLVFIPGGFCKNELGDRESRYEFLRLLVRDDLPDSLRLSHGILKEFVKQLGVPILSKADGAHYLNKISLKVKEGIYARNLALTRLIHSPVCYGESLIQNNIDECLLLNRKDFIIDSTPCSSRIKQVAEAYYNGIYQFLLDK